MLTFQNRLTRRTISSLAPLWTLTSPLERVSARWLLTRAGVIGGVSLSPKVANRVQSLALLLDNEDAFEMAFTTKHQEDKKETKQKGKQNDHIDNLLQQSRTFFVNEIQHQY